MNGHNQTCSELVQARFCLTSKDSSSILSQEGEKDLFANLIIIVCDHEIII